MITLKSAHEIELMRRAGKITAAARAVARDMVKPGVTTQQIDKAVYKFITEQGATPSFLHYNGYPASVCVSVNDEIIHGIPGKRVLQEGDIGSVDVGAFIGSVPPSRASLRASGTPRRAIACPTSPPPFRRMPRVRATASSGSMWVTASGATCTRRRRCPTMAAPAMAPACCGA